MLYYFLVVMNVRSYTLDFTVESQHVKDVLSSLFHTILFHRSFGNISYKKEGTYSIGKFSKFYLA